MSQWTGTVSTDWFNAGNWTLGVPNAGIDAIFTGNPSRPCTTAAAQANCRNLITTGFTGANAVLTIGLANLLVHGTTITFGTSTNHLDPTNSQGLISIQTSGTIITSNSATVIVPGITNINFNYIINLVGSISVKRFVPIGNSTYTSSTAGTFIDIVTGGSIQGGGGPGTNVTLRINGSCAINTAGFSTKGNIVLATGSTLTLNGILDFNNSTASIDFSAGTLIPNLQTFQTQNSYNVTVNLGSNSFYNVTLSGNGIFTILSNINITRDLTIIGAVVQLNGAFNITVGRNLSGGALTATSTTAKLILTGTGSGGTVTVTNFSFGGFSPGNNYTLEINCGSNNVIFTGTSTTTGSSTASAIVNYLPGNIGTLTTTSHTFSYTGSILTINMNGVAGPTKSWGVIKNTGGVGRSVALLSNVFCQTLGDSATTTGTSNGDIFTSVGGPYYLGILGNAEKINLVSSSSTAELRFVGSTPATFTTANPANTMAIDIRTDKTGGAAVTFPAVFNWGAANKTLNLNSTANFATNSTTLTLVGTPLTILNASDSQFYNLTTGTGFTTTPQTINLN